MVDGVTAHPAATRRDDIDLVLDRALTFEPPTVTPRDIMLDARDDECAVLLGMRRAGKTSRIFQAIRDLREAGIHPEHMLYLNLEQERLLPLATRDLGDIVEAWEARVPSLGADGGHLFIDEIQHAPLWEVFVRRMLDERRHRVTVAGSAADLLRGDYATSLRGRSRLVEVLPFSFREWSRHHRLDLTDASQHAAWFAEWLEQGGLASSFRGRLPDTQRLEDLAMTVVYRDVAERGRIRDLPALHDVVRALLSMTGRLLTLNRLKDRLQAIGHRTTRPTLASWLRLLEEAHLCALVEYDSPSVQRRRVNPWKVHINDHALAHAWERPRGAGLGQRLETAVHWQLRRRGHRLTYLGLGTEGEVDLVAEDPSDRSRQLVQVCAHLSHPETLKRELAALEHALSLGTWTRATLISLEPPSAVGLDEVMSLGEGRVHLVAAPTWFAAE